MRVKRLVVVGGSGEGREGRLDGGQRIWGSETTLYDTVLVDTCHYTCIKTYRMYSAKREP